MAERPSKTKTPDRFNNPCVIINLGSGSADNVTDEICEIFKAHGLCRPAVHAVEPSGLGDAFDKVRNDQTDLLVILGGDGTCMAGAKIARQLEIPLIALPGGTMNLLPKALYGTADWKEALETALSAIKPRWQSAGTINDQIFYCGAFIGDPTVISEARESVRDGEMMSAVRQVPEILSAVASGLEFSVQVDGDELDRASGLLHLSCPAMQENGSESGAFEVASLPQLSLGRLIAIGAKALTSEWKEAPEVKTAKAQSLTVEGQDTCDLLLDGEPFQMTCPIKITLDPKGVLVLAPDLQNRETGK